MAEIPRSSLTQWVEVRSYIGADSVDEILAEPVKVPCVFNHKTLRQRGAATSKTATQTQALVQLQSAYRFVEGSLVHFSDGRSARVVRVETAERTRRRHAVITCE